jgi:hypothetical protein
VELDEVEQAAGCAPWQCANSSEVLHYLLHELHLFGEPNAQDMTLPVGDSGRAQLYANGDKYDLHVEDNRFVGKSKQGDVQGLGLIGAELDVLKGGDLLYTITIRSVREIDYPVGEKGSVELYKLTRRVPGSVDELPACNSPDYPLVKGDADLHDMDPDETLIFAGDRIDPVQMTTSHEADNGWFNFGCAGHTLAKLHLTRNTIASNGGASWEQRQATFKMFVGDYCGKGVPITVAGAPIRWEGGLVKYAPTPDKLEAHWTAEGAKCVNTMRLEANPSPLIEKPRQILESTCHMPDCDGYDLDSDGGMPVTAIPL